MLISWFVILTVAAFSATATVATVDLLGDEDNKVKESQIDFNKWMNDRTKRAFDALKNED